MQGCEGQDRHEGGKTESSTILVSMLRDTDEESLWAYLNINFLDRKLLVAIIILHPLLGLTWLFGFLAISKNTTVFIWIFTILNSLQVYCVITKLSVCLGLAIQLRCVG